MRWKLLEKDFKKDSENLLNAHLILWSINRYTYLKNLKIIQRHNIFNNFFTCKLKLNKTFITNSMYFYQSPRTADHDLEWRINIPLSTHRIEIFATPALSAG